MSGEVSPCVSLSRVSRGGLLQASAGFKDELTRLFEGKGHGDLKSAAFFANTISQEHLEEIS